MDRTILHCDLNNFFASVSLLYNQTLYGLPVAVAGDKENRHGIILAKNELAKRFGVCTAEPIWQARQKCPELILLPPIYDRYEEYSRAAREIYGRYTDQVEPFGIDECWLDVTGSRRLFGSGENIGNLIRRDMKQELGLTVSVGVSFNKIFAKLGSDLKKPDGLTVIDRQHFRQQLRDLPCEDLLFVGKKTAEQLHSRGIFTLGELSGLSEEFLAAMLGKSGRDLYRFVQGEDHSPVRFADEQTPPKSIGRSQTTARDLASPGEIYGAFLRYSEEIVRDLRKYRLVAAGVQITLRTPDLAVRECSATLDTPTDVAETLAKKGMELLRQKGFSETVFRSVGIRATRLRDASCARQQTLFSKDREERSRRLEDTLFSIREKYGESAVFRCPAARFSDRA